MSTTKIIGFIPARYASSRLPGKPLSDIAGLPMIAHVYHGVSQSKILDDVIVLTDDARIKAAVELNGGSAFMTPENCRNGTERIAWAIDNIPIECGIAVNIQGDEPMITGELVDRAAAPLLKDADVDIATLACLIHDMKELRNPAAVKVVCDNNMNALYFSRSPIPHPQNIPPEDKDVPYYKHIGIYAYHAKVVKHVTSVEPTPLERAEKLEQLRMLELGYKIAVTIVEHSLIGVDTQEDLDMVRLIFNSKFKIQNSKL
ncbi:MAG: 3-deoxy-manno-octulosonate cytidylyltransferase [FCB group bacterium]|nr:3-deoxy-manno-octulosonate cytidylyltransferase [FCB group bacterium]